MLPELSRNAALEAARALWFARGANGTATMHDAVLAALCSAHRHTASHVADAVHADLRRLLHELPDNLSDAGADGTDALASLARIVVLRAFGCTCRSMRLINPDDQALHFEDATCPVHPPNAAPPPPRAASFRSTDAQEGPDPRTGLDGGRAGDTRPHQASGQPDA